MRVLALSDIHGNVGIVSRLRAREANVYDLLIVAGDIGGGRAREICDILDTFGCPVVYVFGNHDYDLAYDFDLGANGHHLHGSPLVVDKACLVGFSGCPTNWGRNPICANLCAEFDHEEQTTHAQVLADLKALDEMKPIGRQRAKEKLMKTDEFRDYDNARKALGRNIVGGNRAELVNALSQATRTELFNITVTHERLTRAELLTEADCLIHGHIHQFSSTISKGKRQLNVAALDKPLTVGPAGGLVDLANLSNIDTGNYVTFEVTGRAIRNLTVKTFGWNMKGWVRLEGFRARGAGVKTAGADPSRDCEEVYLA